ncbi:hypothetical protein NPIL_199501 [Nephila pilipes]|uniref:Transposase Tc1-like domain-containing protein n=1 Tax=Nephila pilipes TaxID=299642 RepID=A0A8X6T9A3_NEPPI|nr:hypothetical protein NPIL_199501 [Nephila pilipes]
MSLWVICSNASSPGCRVKGPFPGGKSHRCITESVANISRNGRKEIIRTTAKRKIIRSIKKNPMLSTPKLASSMPSKIGKSVSAETVRCVHHIVGFHGHTPIPNTKATHW